MKTLLAIAALSIAAFSTNAQAVEVGDIWKGCPVIHVDQKINRITTNCVPAASGGVRSLDGSGHAYCPPTKRS